MKKIFNVFMIILSILTISIPVAKSKVNSSSIYFTNVEACKTQKFHCNEAEAFPHIHKIEEEIIGKKGLYQWYWHHNNDESRKPAAQKHLELTVNKDGSAHWGN